MVAKSAPTAERKTALAVFFRVMIIAEIKPRDMLHFRSLDDGLEMVLLPIEPPEVYAVFFFFCVNAFKKSVHIAFVSGIKFHVESRFGRKPQLLHEIGIGFLMGADTVVRVVVLGDENAVIMQLSEKLGRIFDESVVPSVACPAEVCRVSVACGRTMLFTFFRAAICPIVMMPIHIDDHDIEREIVLIVFIDDSENFFIGIRPPTGIP